MRAEEYDPNYNPNLQSSETEKLQNLFDEQKREWKLTGLPNQELLMRADEAVESAKVKGENVNLDALSTMLRLHRDYIFISANRKGFKFLGHPNDRLYKERNIMVLMESAKYEMRISNLQNTIMALKRRLAEFENKKTDRDVEIIRKKTKSVKKEKL